MMLSRIFGKKKVHLSDESDAAYFIRRAGYDAGAALITQTILQKNPDMKLNSIKENKIEAGAVLGGGFINAPADIQATLSIEGGARSGQDLAVFEMACPKNAFYKTDVSHFHKFFERLGFSRDQYRHNSDFSRLPEGNGWYAHFCGDLYDPEKVQKDRGSFKIAVTTDDLIKKLGIEEAYQQVVTAAHEKKAQELKVTLISVIPAAKVVSRKIP